MSTHASLASKLRSGCLFSALLSLCFVIGLTLVTLGLSHLGEGPVDVIERSEGGQGVGGQAIAVISMSGVMLRDQVGSGITSDLLLMLRKAARDDMIKGVLLRLNTPGGSVTDADLIYHELRHLEELGKPVLLLMDDTCASGGFYASLAAREVWAMPTTITGSIGVIVSNLNFSALLERHGVTDESVTSGPNKAILSSTTAPKPEHRAILQGIVDQLYERFLKLLRERRGLDEPVARRLADGSIYTAQDALKHKLIDKIGYPEEALKRAKTLAKLPPKSRVVHYSVPQSFFSRFSSQLGLDSLSSSSTPWSSSSLSRGGNELTELSMNGPRAYYLYAPNGALWSALRMIYMR